MPISKKLVPLLGLAAAAGFLPCLAAEPAPVRRPNIILILTDDQGWTGSSVQMAAQREDSRSDYHRTPNLEKLAGDGMRFSNAYAPAAVCSPTRHAIQWGKSPARLGITFNTGKTPRTNGSPAIAQLLKRVDPNYATGHFGKWHIKLHPSEAGFDESDGRTGNDDGNLKGDLDYSRKWKALQAEVDRAAGERQADPAVADLTSRKGDPAAQIKLAELLAPDDPKVAKALQALPTDKIAPIPFTPDNPKRIFEVTQRSADFMERQVAAHKPFFLQVSHYAVHIKTMARKETLAKYQKLPKGEHHDRADFAAMTEDLDSGLGLLLDKIEELGIADNTYVFYTSDNGAYGDHNYPLSKGKFYLWEGGLRVPLVVRGPGIAKGSFCDVPVTGMDFLPTFCALAGEGLQLPDGLDGNSFKPLLEHGNQGTITRKDPALIFHYPNFFGEPKRGKAYGERPQSAIRVGNYKLIKYWDNEERMLFDLDSDIGEQKNLLATMPEKAAELHDHLMDYLRGVDALIPGPDTKSNRPAR
jgi:arylsulfatase A